MNVELLLSHPAPSEGPPLRLQALVRISGRAPEASARPPLNLALVLDRSGSMSGEKLENARQAAALLLRRLGDADRVSVVAYDDQVQTLAEGATGPAHQEAIEAVRRIHAGSTTNLSGGWLRGWDLVRAVRGEGGGPTEGLSETGESDAPADTTPRILLMTDGLANAGITQPAALTGLCRTAREEGISTTTIGFGQGYDEDLLRAMADAGGGAAYYIENPDQAPGVFEEEIEGLLGLAAQNVELVLTPGSGTELVAVRHSYPTTQTETELRLDIGDLYGHEPRLALMEFDLEDARAGVELDVASLRVRGHVLEDGGVEEREVTLPITLKVGVGPRVEPEVRRIALLLDAADVRDEALAARDRGDWDGASDRLRETAERIEAELSGDVEGEREVNSLRAMATRMQPHVFDAADLKYMKQQVHDQRRSRTAARERYERPEG
ncbi:MAG: VWA domain-containing protein [Gemmatimonadales bacterium]|nr:MAG: VWA domain-containing protein [Gemmatimonadales bacterium]